MNTHIIRFATIAATALTLGGMSLAAPLSALAYYGAIPTYQPAYSACSGQYDPNCFLESTNYLNQSSIGYEPYSGYSNYNTSSYNNSYYGNSWNMPSYNSYSSYPSYSNSYSSYYPSSSYNSYYAPSYGYNSYPSYGNSYYNTPSYSYQYQYQYQYQY